MLVAQKNYGIMMMLACKTPFSCFHFQHSICCLFHSVALENAVGKNPGFLHSRQLPKHSRKTRKINSHPQMGKVRNYANLGHGNFRVFP